MRDNFDDLMRNKLQNAEVSYQPADWAIMEEMLQKEDFRPIPWYAQWRTQLVAAAAVIVPILFVSITHLSKHERLLASQKQVSTQQAPLMAETQTSPTIEESYTVPPHTTTTTPSHTTTTHKTNPTTHKHSITPIQQATHTSRVTDPISKPAKYASIPSHIQPQKAQLTTSLPHTAVYTPLSFLQKEEVTKSIASYDLQKEDGLAYELARPKSQQAIAPKLQAIEVTDILQGEVKVGGYAASQASMSAWGEKWNTGFTSGARVEVGINDMWSIVSGLQYSQKEYTDTYYTYLMHTRAESNLQHAQYEFLEIPLQAKYEFADLGRIKFYAQTGMNMMIALSEQYTQYHPDNTSQGVIPTNQLRPSSESRNFNVYAGNIFLASGAEINLSDRLSLNLEPFLQLGLQPMGPESKKLHTAGLGLSLNYALHNRKFRKVS